MSMSPTTLSTSKTSSSHPNKLDCLLPIPLVRNLRRNRLETIASVKIENSPGSICWIPWSSVVATEMDMLSVEINGLKNSPIKDPRRQVKVRLGTKNPTLSLVDSTFEGSALNVPCHPLGEPQPLSPPRKMKVYELWSSFLPLNTTLRNHMRSRSKTRYRWKPPLDHRQSFHSPENDLDHPYHLFSILYCLYLFVVFDILSNSTHSFIS